MHQTVPTMLIACGCHGGTAPLTAQRHGTGRESNLHLWCGDTRHNKYTLLIWMDTNVLLCFVPYQPDNTKSLLFSVSPNHDLRKVRYIYIHIYITYHSYLIMHYGSSDVYKDINRDNWNNMNPMWLSIYKEQCHTNEPLLKYWMIADICLSPINVSTKIFFW